MKQAHRFSGAGKAYDGLTTQTKAGPQWTGVVRTVEDALLEPLSWRKPARVFVNSMSDLFHEDVPDEFIDKVFAVMSARSVHTFQILTKRPERMRAYLNDPLRHDTVIEAWSRTIPQKANRRTVERWPLPNVWLGVSVENQKYADERIPLLLQTPAAVRFLSVEPQLGPVDLRHYIGLDGTNSGADFFERHGWGYDAWSGGFTGPNTHNDSCYAPEPGLHWVIVGGESGHGARPFDLAWARSIVQQCKAAGVPVFVKQLGATALAQEDVDFKDGNLFMGRPARECLTVPAMPNGQFSFRDRKGGDPSEWPDDLRIRQFPEVVNAR